MALTRVGPEQDNFLLGPGQPDVEQPTFFSQVGTPALHREEALFHATHEDHGKLYTFGGVQSHHLDCLHWDWAFGTGVFVISILAQEDGLEQLAQRGGPLCQMEQTFQLYVVGAAVLFLPAPEEDNRR